MSLRRHRAALTPATKAVIAVDQGGVPVDLAPIREMCDPLGVTVVEDAACAIGSRYHGRAVGAGAEVAAWSFHPRKILTTGEGGMLSTSRQDFADTSRRLREHAMSVSAADRHASILAPPEEYLEIGFNYRMTDLQAAVGLVQLGRLGKSSSGGGNWQPRMPTLSQKSRGYAWSAIRTTGSATSSRAGLKSARVSPWDATG